MTRRGVLRVLALAVVGVPGALTTAAARPTSPWRLTGFVEQEFDYGSAVGVALNAEHRVTGQLLRNAVRIDLPCGRRRVSGDHVRAREEARRLPHDWLDDMNLDRPSSLGRGVCGDDVLEGREFRTPNAARCECTSPA